ncbi:DUF222 domain-containing protein, partial [Mycobacterium lehmannii]|uniref:DUF222 domain-containing protein n=1 Tax=Mycobacterium lehmannii TaxID=2048550 RepID=UPI000E71B94C
MSLTAAADIGELSPDERLGAQFAALEALAGQRNAIDGRIVDIVAQIERERSWGATGARSVKALVAWKLGLSETTAKAVTAIAQRIEEFPRCTTELREGRLSLDQVGVIAQRAATGSDEHYAQLASVATVSQLRFAIKLEPRPEPERPAPSPEPSLTKTVGEQSTTYRITLP